MRKITKGTRLSRWRTTSSNSAASRNVSNPGVSGGVSTPGISGGVSTPGVSGGVSNPIQRSFGPKSAEVSPTVRVPEEMPRQSNSFEESQEMQEIAELRKFLQECRSQDILDPNIQDKILDIISRLQTLNQYN